MQSLKVRFNGQTQEVIEYARQFGVLGAMEQYQVKDYTAMLRFLDEGAPGYHFPITNHNPDKFSEPNAFDKLLEAMLRRYDQLNAKVASLESQNSTLKRDRDYYKANRWQETSRSVQAILKECSEEEAILSRPNRDRN